MIFGRRKAAPPAKRDDLAGVPHGPERAERTITNIFGKSGEGKTTLLVRLYIAAIMRGMSGTFVDSTGNNRYVARAGFDRGAVCGVVTTADGWLSLVKRAAREQRRYNIVLVPESIDMSPRSHFWTMLRAAGNALAAFDDAEDWFPSSQNTDKTPLGSFIAKGRHSQVSILNSVRTPPEMHPRIRSIADVTICFRLNELSYARLIGQDVMHSPAAVQRIMRLPQFHYLRYEQTSLRLSWGKVQRPS